MKRKRFQGSQFDPKVVSPLYQILEQKLQNHQDPFEDHHAFIREVTAEYLSFLRKRGLSIPSELELGIASEFEDEVKKTYFKMMFQV